MLRTISLFFGLLVLCLAPPPPAASSELVLDLFGDKDGLGMGLALGGGVPFSGPQPGDNRSDGDPELTDFYPISRFPVSFELEFSPERLRWAAHPHRAVLRMATFGVRDGNIYDGLGILLDLVIRVDGVEVAEAFDTTLQLGIVDNQSARLFDEVVVPLPAEVLPLLADGHAVVEIDQVQFDRFGESIAIDYVELVLEEVASQFADREVYELGALIPAFPTVEDLDGDGLQDLAITSGRNAFTLLLGTGNGTFRLRRSYIESPPSGSWYEGNATGDFDDDGELEIAVGDLTIDGFRIFDVQAVLDGVEPEEPAVFASVLGPWSMRAGLLDGDHVPDLVTGGIEQHPGDLIGVHINDGMGDLSAKTDLAAGSDVRAIELVDIDGDQVLDIVAGSGPERRLRVFMGNGEGGFAVGPSVTGVGGFGVATGDIDGDGNADVVTTAGVGDQAEVFYGDGSGGLEDPSRITVGVNPNYPAVGDFNADCVNDFAVPNNASNTVSVVFGGADRTLWFEREYTVGAQPGHVAAFDMNLDGWDDLVVTDAGSSTLSVLLNHGALAPPRFEFEWTGVGSELDFSKVFFPDMGGLDISFTRLEGGVFTAQQAWNIPGLCSVAGAPSDLQLRFGSTSAPFDGPALLELSDFEDGDETGVVVQRFTPLPGTDPSFELVSHGAVVAFGSFVELTIETTPDLLATASGALLLEGRPAESDSSVFDALLAWTGGTGLLRYELDSFSTDGDPVSGTDAEQFASTGRVLAVPSPSSGTLLPIAIATLGWVARRRRGSTTWRPRSHPAAGDRRRSA